LAHIWKNGAINTNRGYANLSTLITPLNTDFLYTRLRYSIAVLLHSFEWKVRFPTIFAKQGKIIFILGRSSYQSSVEVENRDISPGVSRYPW